MSVRCPKCGVSNRNTAKFCSGCSEALPSQTSSAVTVSGAQQTPSSQQQIKPSQRQLPVSVGQPPPVPVASKRPRGVVVDGKVSNTDPDYDDKPPRDTSRLLVVLSFLLFLLGICGIGVVAALVVWIVALILGISGLGCLFFVLLMPAKIAFSSIFDWIRGEQSATVLSLQVFDDLLQRPVDVHLFRKPGTGGNVRLGDRVQVFGKWQSKTNIVRAYRVRVYESGGRTTDYTIEAMKPWPLWVGLFVFVATTAVLVYLTYQAGLIS